jgi:ATP-dependent Clp protease ATP-binding subunit ClpC
MVDFKNTVIIMTSNVGTQHVRQHALGFATGSRSETRQLRDRVEEELKKTFRPEFLNRIDETIVFEPLDEAQVRQIVNLLVNDLRQRLGESGVALERAIQRYIENPLSKQLLRHTFNRGDTVLIDAGDDGLTFVKQDTPPVGAASAASDPVSESA